MDSRTPLTSIKNIEKCEHTIKTIETTDESTMFLIDVPYVLLMATCNVLGFTRFYDILLDRLTPLTLNPKP